MDQEAKDILDNTLFADMPPLVMGMLAVTEGGDPSRMKKTFGDVCHFIKGTIFGFALLDPSEESIDLVKSLCENYDQMLCAFESGKFSTLSFKIRGLKLSGSVPDKRLIAVSPSSVINMLSVCVQQLLNGCELIIAVINWNTSIETYISGNKRKRGVAYTSLPASLTNAATCYGLDLFVGGVSGMQAMQGRFYQNIPAFAPEQLDLIRMAIPFVEFKGSTMSFAEQIMGNQKAFLQ